MGTVLFLLYMFAILVYVTVYVTRGNGLWENVEMYTPNWSEKYTIYAFIYLTLIFFIVNYYLSTFINNMMFRKLNFVVLTLLILLFAFTVFCLSKGPENHQEAFILMTIAFGLLIVNTFLILLGNRGTFKLLALLPLPLFLYLYSWVYEIKNNS